MRLAGYDGILVPGGFGLRGTEGKILSANRSRNRFRTWACAWACRWRCAGLLATWQGFPAPCQRV